MVHFGSIKLGARHLNLDAKNKKDVYSSSLKQLKKCPCGGDSFIDFEVSGNIVKVVPQYCCDTFEALAIDQLSKLLQHKPRVL